MELTDKNENRKTNVLLMGATTFSVLSASCCVLPIGRSIIGLGGSWLAFLSPFVAYREIILLLVGSVFILVWIRLIRYQRLSASRPSALVVISLSTIIFFAALSAPLWEKDLTQYLWAYMIETR